MVVSRAVAREAAIRESPLLSDGDGKRVGHVAKAAHRISDASATTATSAATTSVRSVASSNRRSLRADAAVGALTGLRTSEMRVDGCSDASVGSLCPGQTRSPMRCFFLPELLAFDTEFRDDSEMKDAAELLNTGERGSVEELSDDSMVGEKDPREGDSCIEGARAIGEPESSTGDVGGA